jgi:hypothetical protein
MGFPFGNIWSKKTDEAFPLLSYGRLVYNRNLRLGKLFAGRRFDVEQRIMAASGKHYSIGRLAVFLPCVQQMWTGWSSPAGISAPLTGVQILAANPV